MKLLQLLYSGLGGHGSVAFTISKGDETEFFQHQLIFYGIEAMTDEYRNRCQQHNIPYINILKKQGSNLIPFIHVYKALHTLKPECIILHCSNVLIPVFLYCRLKNIPWVIVEHQDNNKKRKSEWVWTILSMFLPNAVVHITPKYSDEIENILPKFLFKKHRVHHIPNGIDTDIFCPDNNRKSNNPYKIAMIGRFTPLRDFENLIKGVKILVDKGIQVRLFLAGDGETKQALHRAYADENIVFTGTLNENDIVLLLQSCDLYVHASFAETMSTAIMQAMACALPIVATDIPGIQSMVKDGEHGFLTTPENPHALAEKIELLLKNPNLRDTFGANARSYAVQYFSSLRMFNQYKDLIVSIKEHTV